jgi:hypothetical protein
MIRGVIRQSTAQLVQRIDRDLRRAHGHGCAYRRLAHPNGNLPRDVRTNLKMKNLLTSSCYSLANTQALPM